MAVKYTYGAHIEGDECRMRVCVSVVMRRIFGTKRDEVKESK
jgi:hypothetical protein